MARAKIRIKKGDNVYVLSGKEKGKTGKILDIDHERQRALVEKLMVVKRHYKRGRNHAAPEGGIIEVSAQTIDGLATIVVRDSGRGIEPALLPHIFERYRQATSAELGGLGLGLTTVKHLVEMHGGDVRADSEGAGKGATFTVRLPLKTE